MRSVQRFLWLSDDGVNPCGSTPYAFIQPNEIIAEWVEHISTKMPTKKVLLENRITESTFERVKLPADREQPSATTEALGAVEGMKFYLQMGECPDLFGPFNSIGLARIEAEMEAKSLEQPMKAIIWDTRAATAQDRDLFEHSDHVDVDRHNWWEGCRVPVNEVLRFTTALQAV